MIFALKITKKNKYKIILWNGGMKPPKNCFKDGDYLITWTDYELNNIIRSKKDFLKDFAWVDKEVDGCWSEVREL